MELQDKLTWKFIFSISKVVYFNSLKFGKANAFLKCNLCQTSILDKIFKVTNIRFINLNYWHLS